jgi:hypothetical protein
MSLLNKEAAESKEDAAKSHSNSNAGRESKDRPGIAVVYRSFVPDLQGFWNIGYSNWLMTLLRRGFFR